MFYLCIPVGFAAGYVFGGLVAAGLGWRAAFLIESAVMVPFVIFASVSQPLHLTGSREVGPGEGMVLLSAALCLDGLLRILQGVEGALELCLAGGICIAHITAACVGPASGGSDTAVEWQALCTNSANTPQGFVLPLHLCLLQTPWHPIHQKMP
jgi:MFS family permease